MSDTFDTYYDILPYHSFQDLYQSEGKLPLEESDIPPEFLAAMEAGEFEDTEDLRLLYGDEELPPQ